MPYPPPVPQVGLSRAQKCGTGALDPVGGRDNHIVPVLDHAQCQTYYEGLCCHVKVAQHDVATPPPHKPDCVYVDSGKTERHGDSSLHGTCANIFGLETNF